MVDLVLVQSDEQRVEISGEKSDKVKIKENNGVLKIMMIFPETIADGKVKATLYFNKKISVIDANEGAIITGKNLKQQTLEVKAQEGAFINMAINTRYLKVKAISGGVIKLSGTTENQEVRADLGGIYHGYNLKASSLSEIKAGSGAKAEVYAIGMLEAKATFGGTIFYHGKPNILKERKVIGGIIEQRN